MNNTHSLWNWNIWNIVYILATETQWTLVIGSVGVLVWWLISEFGPEPVYTAVGLGMPALGTAGAYASRRIKKHARTRRSAKTPEQQMIDAVEEIWIKGFLHVAVPKDKRFDVPLIPPPEGVVKGKGHFPIPRVKTSDDVMRAYEIMERTDKGMLILGNPGSGKTIMMLQLAERLLKRARDGKGRIPIVLNLASWAQHKKPLHEWIEDEMKQIYGDKVPASLWKEDITHPNKFMYLLDGLDEVKSGSVEHANDTLRRILDERGLSRERLDESRSACALAINTFCNTYPDIPVVVCSRIKENRQLREKLELGAIQVEPLPLEKVEEHLKDNLLTGLLDILQRDAEYRELASEPFILNTMVIAYQGWDYEALNRSLNEYQQDRLTHLLNTYISRRIEQKSEVNKQEHIRSYINWLAAQMQKYGLQVFHTHQYLRQLGSETVR